MSVSVEPVWATVKAPYWAMGLVLVKALESTVKASGEKLAMLAAWASVQLYGAFLSKVLS